MQCLAKVILVSSQLLSWLQDMSVMRMKILLTIKRLTTEDILHDIKMYEDEAGYLWYTLVPNVTVLFQPLLRGGDSELCVLQTAAQNLFVSSLTVILGRKNHMQVLFEEGLVDFVVCLPWYTTGVVQERAMELVCMIRRSPDIQYQPPSLLNISKAAVSVCYCGLDDVMSLSVPELASKILTR